jgi:hypothetical protein
VTRVAFTRLGLTAVALLLAGDDAGAAPGGFTFTAPPGWTDISRGTPEAQRRNAPPDLLTQADNPAVAFAAADLAHRDGGFVDNMNAIVQRGAKPPVPTPDGIAEMAKGMQDQATQQGGTYRSFKAELVKIAGVSSVRFVGEMKQRSGVVTSLVQYAIPGDRAFAALTFTTTPEKLSQSEPVFEAAAQATRGAIEPHPNGTLLPSWMIGVLAGLAAAAASTLAIRAKRKGQASR